MPRADGYVGGFVPGIVGHLLPLRMEELNRLQFVVSPKKSPFLPNRTVDQLGLAPHASLSGIYDYDNQVKNRIWREQFP